MPLSNNLKMLRKKFDITQKELSDATNIPLRSIINYENGIREPGARALVALENFFGVSGSSLMGNANFIPFHNLSKESLSIARKYQSLDNYGKTAVATLLELEQRRSSAQAEMMEASLDFSPKIPLKISEQPASAGTGVYLGPDGFSEWSVENHELTRRAAFGVPISGDSMEPQYHDGDIILVNFEPTSFGDIALVTMDGCGYVKKIGHGELLSLNPQYPPIPMTEDIRINGKVIGILDPRWI